jgi:hypothetical protein
MIGVGAENIRIIDSPPKQNLSLFRDRVCQIIRTESNAYLHHSIGSYCCVSQINLVVRLTGVEIIRHFRIKIFQRDPAGRRRIKNPCRRGAVLSAAHAFGMKLDISMKNFESLRAKLAEAVPFAKHAGVEIVEIADGFAVAQLTQSEQRSNHLGSIHAGAIFTLGETASGAAMIGAFAQMATMIRPVATSAKISEAWAWHH